MRYLSNHSSGKQGHAIAAALAALGAETVLVSGPTQEPTPSGVRLVAVETARQMLAASEAALPVDVAVMAAAVSDWRVESRGRPEAEKGRQGAAGAAPRREPGHPRDASLLARNDRPALVIGFAAETENVVANALEKRRRKGCDWILANDVSPGTGTFGGDSNTIHLVDGDGVEDWPAMTKTEVAARLADRIASRMEAAGGLVGNRPSTERAMPLPVELKILDPRLPGWGFPHYGSERAAGLDLHACIDGPLLLEPQAPAVLISAGIAFRIGGPRTGARWCCRARVWGIARGWCSATRSG